jgi:5-methylcytosine-specific restriction endonuclease McrA
MKLVCAHCTLRWPVADYITDAAVQSVCVLCRRHGVAAADFANSAAQLFAQSTALAYQGAAKTTGTPWQFTKTARRQAEGIVDSYMAAPPAVLENITPEIFGNRLWRMLQTEHETWPQGDLRVVLASWGYPVETLFNQNTLDLTTRQYIREKYRHICQYCGRYGNSVDHMDPVSHSGNNNIANLTLACAECNQLKGDMPYADFMRIDQTTAPLKADLRRLEKTQKALKQHLLDLQGQLAALTHQAADPTAPGADALRQKIKENQDLVDQSRADSMKISQLRGRYVQSQWTVAQYREETRGW